MNRTSTAGLSLGGLSNQNLQNASVFNPKAPTVPGAQFTINNDNANATDKKNDVLIVNPTNDPATPYKWAVGLNKLLPGSKLISLKSNGHTGHNRGSKCVDSAVNNFLINGQIPQENLTCSLN